MKLNGATSKELIAEVKKEYAHGNPFTYFDPNFMCDTTHCTKGKGHPGLCSVDIRVGKRKRPSLWCVERDLPLFEAARCSESSGGAGGVLSLLLTSSVMAIIFGKD